MNPGSPTEAAAPDRHSRLGEPTWEVAEFFPRQGDWSESEYLALSTGRLVELVDGRLEVLPLANILHQLIVAFLYEQLKVYVQSAGEGTVLFAPLPVRLGPRWFREPDIVFLRPGRVKDVNGQPEGADLVIEVLSAGKENRQRDLEIKRQEYAAAGIAEYWIVDPEGNQILVLVLEGNSYREAGAYGIGGIASSMLLDGFSVDVEAVFRAGETKSQP